MNAQFLHIDAEKVKAEIANLKAAFPELVEDDQLLLDTIEGSTDLFSIISKAINERADALGMVDTIKARKSDLSSREARFERKGEAMKRLVQALMEAAGQSKITLPEATIYETKPRQTVEITDLEAVPQGYFKTVKQADKDAIKASLLAGEEIPGAALATGAKGLTIKTK